MYDRPPVSYGFKSDDGTVNISWDDVVAAGGFVVADGYFKFASPGLMGDQYEGTYIVPDTTSEITPNGTMLLRCPDGKSFDLYGPARLYCAWGNSFATITAHDIFQILSGSMDISITRLNILNPAKYVGNSSSYPVNIEVLNIAGPEGCMSTSRLAGSNTVVNWNYIHPDD